MTMTIEESMRHEQRPGEEFQQRLDRLALALKTLIAAFKEGTGASISHVYLNHRETIGIRKIRSRVESVVVVPFTQGEAGMAG